MTVIRISDPRARVTRGPKRRTRRAMVRRHRRQSDPSALGVLHLRLPLTYRGVDLGPGLVRPVYQAGVVLVVRAVHLVRPIVGALLHPSPQLGAVRPEEQLGVAPPVRPVDVPRDVGLEERVVHPLHLPEVHVGRLGELVAVVPLPAGVVPQDLEGGAVGPGGGGAVDGLVLLAS